MKTYLLVAVLMVLAGAQTVEAGADVDAGKAKAQACAACHGVGGNSANPEWPNLAGQHAGYIAKQLADFKAGKQRKDPIMSGQAANLSPQDMADLGAYFATLTPAGGFVSKERLPLGERIYRGGNQASNVPACIACHGANGAGDPLAGFPALSGQRAAYTAKQLKDFASGARANDPNRTMRDTSRRMTDEEIQAVSEYVSGLR